MNSHKPTRIPVDDEDEDEDIKEFSFTSSFFTNNSRSRLISRKSGTHPNLVQKGDLRRIQYLYFEIIDLSWYRLLFYVLLTFLLYNIMFASLFYVVDGVIDVTNNEENVGWADCFYFSLQTMDTIGYGGLQPKGTAGNLLVYLISYSGGLYWIALTGIVFKKFSRPSRLKRQILFSDVAVINSEIPSFSREPITDVHYVQGDYVADCPCLSFRFAHLRPRSRICNGTLNLLLFERKTRPDGYEDYQLHELDFELNRQLDRIRAVKLSFPLLCLPWTVVHRIDKLSPLYQLTVENMIERNMEIICVVDGIDEASSDSFQVWWSYCPEEIVWNHRFESMVRCVSESEPAVPLAPSTPTTTASKGVDRCGRPLEINYDRISLISPCTNNDFYLKNGSQSQIRNQPSIIKSKPKKMFETEPEKTEIKLAWNKDSIVTE